MTRVTCAAFAEAITSTVHDAGDHRVRALFDKYSRTLGNGYLLTELELQAFYQDQAVAKDEVVRQNLSHQGIGPDLKPLVDWNSLTLETDSRVVRDEAVLPRSKLSRSHELFEQVLDLVDAATGDEAEALWNLLMGLPTNERMETQILNNEDIDGLLGLTSDQGAPGRSSMFRVLYSLQIIQSLVFEYKQRPASKVVAHVQDV